MKYIVAVSGGVDSVALLHMLHEIRQRDSSLELVVAHVNHGVRDDSDADAWHVAALARGYGLPFAMTCLNLGPSASEDQARRRRYEWLENLQKSRGARGVITAHHADDQLETVVLNFQRGTGWRGLASLGSDEKRLRPLVGLSKAQLVRYAIAHGLDWRDDSTNDDVRYTRNYIRHAVIPRLDAKTRLHLATLSKEQRVLREKIEAEVVRVLTSIRDSVGISRHHLIMMPDVVALEVLREATEGRHEPFQLRRLLHFAKTGRQGSVIHLGKGKNALLTRQRLIV